MLCRYLRDMGHVIAFKQHKTQASFPQEVEEVLCQVIRVPRFYGIVVSLWRLLKERIDSLPAIICGISALTRSGLSRAGVTAPRNSFLNQNRRYLC